MFRFFKKSQVVEIASPATGEIVPIEDVPDEEFASKRTGDGVGLILTDGKIIAPFDGEITCVYNANHCLVIKSVESGLELLIHIGIDTIKLKGEGFKRYVELNDRVKKGDLLLEADLEHIKASGKSIITPTIITNRRYVETIDKASGIVEKGQDTIMKVALRKE